MKTILFDQDYNSKLAQYYRARDFSVSLLKDVGLHGVTNGQLLAAAEGRFDVLISMDKNIPYQNNWLGRKLSCLIVRLRRDHIDFHLPYLPEAYEILRKLKPGEIDWVGDPDRVLAERQRYDALIRLRVGR